LWAATNVITSVYQICHVNIKLKET
jgi:hypothetical protein